MKAVEVTKELVKDRKMWPHWLKKYYDDSRSGEPGKFRFFPLEDKLPHAGKRYGNAYDLYFNFDDYLVEEDDHLIPYHPKAFKYLGEKWEEHKKI